MSMYDEATEGIIESAKITLLYGPNKVGKTTFACSFPKTWLFDLEKGSKNVTVNGKRYDKLPDYETFKARLDEFCANPNGFKNLVIDSVESLESRIFEHLLNEGGVKTIEDYGGGFGKGYVRSRELMTQIMKQLQKLTEDHGVEVFLIGHSQQKQKTDPITGLPYDNFSLRTNEKMGSIIRDLSDSILFVCRKLMKAKKDGEEVAVSDNESYIYTSWRLAYDAGNRLNLPNEIKLSYDAFMKAKEIGKSQGLPLDDLKTECMEMAKGLDKETNSKVVASLQKAKTTEEVAAIKTRIQQIVAA